MKQAVLSIFQVPVLMAVCHSQHLQQQQQQQQEPLF
jgi:hypothetical protein